MSFDDLRNIIFAPLNERVATARTELHGTTLDAVDYEAYFKDVFAGAVL